MYKDEDAGTWPALWIPWVAAAHAIAAYLIINTYLVLHPGWLRALGNILLLRSPRAHSRPHHDEGTGGAGGANQAGAGAAAGSSAIGTVENVGGQGKDDEDDEPAGTLSADAESTHALLLTHTLRQWRLRHAGRSSIVDDDVSDDEASDYHSGTASPTGKSAAATATVGSPGSPPSRHGASADAAPSITVLRSLTRALRPLQLEWRALGCSYRSAGGEKSVLQNVCGYAGPGDLLALLGPSGSGKSTLLDMLAARKTVGHLHGTVLVDGAPMTADYVDRTAYVPQDDSFLPVLRAEETLMYHAHLMLPRGTSHARRQQRTNEVLAAVGLTAHRKTLVGGHLPGGLLLRGLSGGERKRLSVACAMISAPSAIFLDEPTSGLDSFAALRVMEYMRAMADVGHTVLASIHQPRSAIWNLFTKVTVLSQGHLMYFGPCPSLVPWFESLGYQYDPRMHGVASDWVMDLVNVGFAKPKRHYGSMMTCVAELEGASQKFAAFYANNGGRIDLEPRRHSSGEDVAAAGIALDSDGVPIAGKHSDPTLAEWHEAADVVPGGTANSDAQGTRPVPPPATADGHLSPAELQAAGGPTAGDGDDEVVTLPVSLAGAGRGICWRDGKAGFAGGGSRSSSSSSGGGDNTRRGLLAGAAGGGGTSASGGAHRPTSAKLLLPVVSSSRPIKREDRTASMEVHSSTPRHFQSDHSHSNHHSFLSPQDEAASVGEPLSPVHGGGLSDGLASAQGDAPAAAMPPLASAGHVVSAGKAPQATLPHDGSRHKVDSSSSSGDAGRQQSSMALLLPISHGGTGSRTGSGEHATAGYTALSGFAPVAVKLQRATWLQQLSTLMWREYVNMARNPADMAGRLLIFCWVGVALGLIFYGATGAFEGIRTRLNVVFMMNSVYMLLPFVYMSLYTADKQFYVADVSARLYSPSAYYIAKTLVLLPFSMLNILTLGFTIYGMVGLRHDPFAVVSSAICIVLGYLIASQVLFLAATLTPNQDSAFMVAIAWTAINILWSDFLIMYRDMRWSWMQHLKYLSAMSYTLEGLMTAEFGDRNFHCNAGFQTDVVEFIPAYIPQTPAAATKYAHNLFTNFDASCLVDMNVILAYFGFAHKLGVTVAILVGYLAVLHALTYLALLWAIRREQR